MNADSARDVRAFQRTLREYTRYNQRELGPLIESRAKRLRFELYRQFKAIAPSKERIEQEAAARNYAIRRRKNKKGKTLSVKQEIAARKRSIGWLSASWIFREWKSRRDGQTGFFKALSRAKTAIGAAIVRTAKGQRSPSVRLTSYLSGVMIQNQRRALVSKAMQAQVADMRGYIARKQKEQFMNLVRRTLPS
ncbi:MAG: hypothetical protein ACP5I4_14515 [Oceanipulchritudo sp.]